jgi:hypothetical protein
MREVRSPHTHTYISFSIVSKIWYVYSMVSIRTGIIRYLSRKICLKNTAKNTETEKEQYVYNMFTHIYISFGSLSAAINEHTITTMYNKWSNKNKTRQLKKPPKQLKPTHTHPSYILLYPNNPTSPTPANHRQSPSVTNPQSTCNTPLENPFFHGLKPQPANSPQPPQNPSSLFHSSSLLIFFSSFSNRQTWQ